MYEGIVGTSGLILWSRNDETRSVWAAAATDESHGGFCAAS